MRRARHNLDLMREFTKKGIAQLRIVRGWQGLAQQTKVASDSNLNPMISNASPHFKAYVEQNKSQEAYMQEQEYGAADEDEEEGVEEKKELAQSALMRASQKIKTVFGSRKSQFQEKGQPSKEGSPSPQSQSKKPKGTIFNWKPYLNKKTPKESQSSKDLFATESKNFAFTKEKVTSSNDPEDAPETQNKQENLDSRRNKRKSFSTFITPQFDFKSILANFRQKQKSSVGAEAKVEKSRTMGAFAKGKKMNQIGTEKSENVDP